MPSWNKTLEMQEDQMMNGIPKSLAAGESKRMDLLKMRDAFVDKDALDKISRTDALIEKLDIHINQVLKPRDEKKKTEILMKNEQAQLCVGILPRKIPTVAMMPVVEVKQEVQAHLISEEFEFAFAPACRQDLRVQLQQQLYTKAMQDYAESHAEWLNTKAVQDSAESHAEWLFSGEA